MRQLLKRLGAVAAMIDLIQEACQRLVAVMMAQYAQASARVVAVATVQSVGALGDDVAAQPK